MASDLILNVLQLKNEELTTRLRRVTLENLIHDDNDFPVSIPVLGEYLSFTFPSDYMLLAVLHRRPKPLLRLSAVRSEDGRPMIQYPREALAAVDDLLRTLLLPKTQFITFRADKDVGILLCPDITYGNTAQMLKYTLSESHLAKSNRITPYFCPQSALIQAARQGLSARIRFANANMILNLALCFSSPRYRVFRKRSCFLTTPNTCSTFARTENFACSAFFAAYWPLLLSFLTWDGRRLILYLILCPASLRMIASSRFSAPR